MTAIDGLSERRVCKVLGVNRSTCWRQSASQNHRPAATKAEVIDLKLASLIKTLAEQYPTYGYRRLWALSRFKHGHKVNKKRIHRICKSLGLQVRTRRRRPQPRAQQLRSVSSRSNERWAIDATTIDCGQDGLGYLVAIIDCHDRELVGWHMSLRGRAKEAVAALEDACLGRFGTLFEDVEKRPVLRSDNGLVFYSRDFQRACREYGLGQEFITPYTPRMNGVIERFFRSIKEECVWLHRFRNFKEAKSVVTQWIRFYNEERPHQSLGYRSPIDMAPARRIAA